MKTGVLVILDGWGWRQEEFGNAIAQTPTPGIDAICAAWPWTTVAASGEAVGLPAGQQGNSEVGHLTIGAGRVIYQPLTRITRAIENRSFFDDPTLVELIRNVKASGGRLHCMGLVSPGGVHSHQDHGLALTRMAKELGVNDVEHHVFTDGRDVAPSSAAGYVGEFVEQLAQIGAGRVATLSGRYYAMDRDQHWERIEPAFRVISGAGPVAQGSAVEYIEQEYAAGRTDEFVQPTRLADYSGFRPGDALVFWNFRPDRARHITHALIDPMFNHFDRGAWQPIPMATFTEYQRGLLVEVVFPREDVHDTLAEVVSRAGGTQFHVAETEKYAHVTYFLNGGKEAAFEGEERMLIPSPRIATYDLQPKMSAPAVTDAVLEHIAKGEDQLIVVNYANADMVGHTGDFAATQTAVACVDDCIARVVEAAMARDTVVLITADHGNAENKIDPSDGSPLTAHTTAPVPLILCGSHATSLAAGGGLQDVAPTLMQAMGLAAPAAMTGKSLAGL